MAFVRFGLTASAAYVAADLSRRPGGWRHQNRCIRIGGMCRGGVWAAMPRVLNMRDFPDGVPHGAIYCGRAMPRWRLKGSPFANPFKLASNAVAAERTECIGMAAPAASSASAHAGEGAHAAGSRPGLLVRTLALPLRLR